ncbi:MAG: aldehyde dehydrogenase family protein, partial [Proteobacteria bacterium]
QDTEKALNAIAQKLEANATKYAYDEALHQGLPANFVQRKSVNFAIQSFRQGAAAVQLLLKNHGPEISYRPTGIISFIVSWNLSLRLVSERLSAALAAGNACLIKVSSNSPITAQILGEILSEVGAPAGLVQFIHGRGDDVGALLSAHPSVRAVTFVGKLSTAEKVAKAALPQFKKVQIAAGTKNSSMILGDADYSALMPKILESFLIGQGQMGWNTSRLFVLESMQSEVFAKLTEVVQAQVPATDPNSNTLWFPMITREAADVVANKVNQLKGEGGKIVVGGHKPSDVSGFFFQPTFSLDLSNCSELQQEEISGPLFIITAVKYVHEMNKWSNTGFYGHSAVLWGSAEKAAKLSE